MTQKITAKPAALSARRRAVLLLTGALVLPAQAVPVSALAAQSSASGNDIPIPATPAIAQAPDPTADTPPVEPQPTEHVRAIILPGSEPMPAVARPESAPPRPGDISLNFPGADVTVVAKAVLGELLHVNYAIAGGVSGPVTLVTGRPVAKSSLLSLFEAALAQGGFALVPVAGGYEIQTAASARAPIASDTMGFGSEVITLRFINPEEVRKVLDPVLPGIVTATDAPGGTITIAGTTGQRSSARDLLRQFDVDWLRNTSFALYVPQKSDARLITPELDKLINAPDSPTHGLVRLIAMENLNGILAISAQPQYLIDVKRWVEILDREGESNERRIWVYRVQNGRARDLTKTINDFRSRARGNNPGMTDLMLATSPDDLAALEEYLAGR